MPIYTQEELLNTEFNNADRGILGGLIKNGLYIMGANSKIGKSMIATALANVTMELVRHSDIKTTLGVYTHIKEAEKADVLEEVFGKKENLEIK